MWNKIKRAFVVTADAAVKTWNWFDGKKRDIGGALATGTLVLPMLGVPEHTLVYKVCFTGTAIFNLLGWGHAAVKTGTGKKLASGLSEKMKKN